MRTAAGVHHAEGGELVLHRDGEGHPRGVGGARQARPRAGSWTMQKTSGSSGAVSRAACAASGPMATRITLPALERCHHAVGLGLVAAQVVLGDGVRAGRAPQGVDGGRQAAASRALEERPRRRRRRGGGGRRGRAAPPPRSVRGWIIDLLSLFTARPLPPGARGQDLVQVHQDDEALLELGHAADVVGVDRDHLLRARPRWWSPAPSAPARRRPPGGPIRRSRSFDHHDARARARSSTSPRPSFRLRSTTGMMRPRRLITPLTKPGARGTGVISLTRMISCTRRTSTPYSSPARKKVARCSVASTALRSSRAGAVKKEMLWARTVAGVRRLPGVLPRAAPGPPRRWAGRRPTRAGPGCPRPARRAAARAAPRRAGVVLRVGLLRRACAAAVIAAGPPPTAADPGSPRPREQGLALALEERGHVQDQHHPAVAHDGGPGHDRAARR